VYIEKTIAKVEICTFSVAILATTAEDALSDDFCMVIWYHQNILFVVGDAALAKFWCYVQVTENPSAVGGCSCKSSFMVKQ
jgi:hypothetical protein